VKTRGLLILLIIILAGLYAYLGMNYVGRQSEQQALAFQTAEITRAVKGMPDPPDGLEEQLSSARVRLVAEQNILPSEVSSSAVISAVLELADDWGVSAVPVETRPWATEKVGDYTYRVLRLSVTASGGYPQVVNFVDRLENGKLETLIVKKVSVTRIQSDGGNPSQGLPVSAILDLAVYARSPEQEQKEGKGSSTK